MIHIQNYNFSKKNYKEVPIGKQVI